MRKVVGWGLIASPLVAMTVFMIVSIGWLATLAIWGGVWLFVGVVWVGAELALS